MGIEPPIPVPTQKSAQQSQPKEGAKAAAAAKTAVMARVRLKAGTRPFASETADKHRVSTSIFHSELGDVQLPQPQAPICKSRPGQSEVSAHND